MSDPEKPVVEMAPAIRVTTVQLFAERFQHGTVHQFLSLYNIFKRPDDWWGDAKPEDLVELIIRSYDGGKGLDNCVMVPCGSLTLGIEADGYVHS